MVWVVVLGVAWLWAFGVLFLDEVDNLELWIRRITRKKLREPRQVGRPPC